MVNKLILTFAIEALACIGHLKAAFCSLLFQDTATCIVMENEHSIW